MLAEGAPAVLKGVIFTRPERCEAAMAEARTAISAETADVIGPFGHYIEACAPGCNKATALQWLAKRLGLELSDVVAFGDSHNDLEMIAECGRGIAVANAVDPVKACADWVSPYSNDESAVGREIEAMLAAGELAPAP